MNGLEQAIEYAGSMTALAKTLKITKGVISQWKRRGQVPALYCPKIERLTKRSVKCEQLNSLVDWPYVRSSANKKSASTAARIK